MKKIVKKPNPEVMHSVCRAHLQNFNAIKKQHMLFGLVNCIVISLTGEMNLKDMGSYQAGGSLVLSGCIIGRVRCCNLECDPY